MGIPQANAFTTPGSEQSGQTNEGKPACGQTNDAANPCAGGFVPAPPGAFQPPNPPGELVCEGRSSGNCNPPD